MSREFWPDRWAKRRRSRDKRGVSLLMDSFLANHYAMKSMTVEIKALLRAAPACCLQFVVAVA